MLRELAEVLIPSDLADSKGVENSGTVVWYVPGAVYATVECRVIDNNADGLKTELLDVNVNDIKLA
jgi:hypothetical protein